MGREEPRTAWTWVITGTGGVLNVMEDFVSKDIPPDASQVPLLENLAARLIAIHDRYSDKPIRTVAEINETRNFGADQVKDDYQGTQPTS